MMYTHCTFKPRSARNIVLKAIKASVLAQECPHVDVCACLRATVFCVKGVKRNDCLAEERRWHD